MQTLRKESQDKGLHYRLQKLTETIYLNSRIPNKCKSRKITVRTLCNQSNIKKRQQSSRFSPAKKIKNISPQINEISAKLATKLYNCSASMYTNIQVLKARSSFVDQEEGCRLAVDMRQIWTNKNLYICSELAWLK